MENKKKRRRVVQGLLLLAVLLCVLPGQRVRGHETAGYTGQYRHINWENADPRSVYLGHGCHIDGY